MYSEVLIEFCIDVVKFGRVEISPMREVDRKSMKSLNFKVENFWFLFIREFVIGTYCYR